MKLGAWLKKNKKTQAWMADQMKTGQANVCRFVAGKVVPTLKTIAKVNQITRGEVSYLDWRVK